MTAPQAIQVYERIMGTTPGATIAAAPGGDAVIVRDSPERLSRFKGLLVWLDLPGPKGRRIYVRPVAHRAASELVDATRRIFGDSLGEDVGLAPDDRTNQLVVHARPVEYVELDRLLRRLDVPARDERRIFVLPGRTSILTPGKRP